MARLHSSLSVGLLGCLVASGGCDDGGGLPTDERPPADVQTNLDGDGASEFVSSIAGGSSGGIVGTDSAESEPARETLDDNPLLAGATDANAGASRAIVEADILQLSGDRLYALSRYNGLTIIDVSNPAELRLLGEHRAAAEPFEMYVEDGLVYAMFNGWYSYVCDDTTGACSWSAQSRVHALDTRDPANIQLVADLAVPGYIADSRRVGDVLYLATEEWGYCWGCQPQSNTTVTSFDLSTPGRFTQVDQLRLPSPDNQTGGGRSISATNQRIYIAGYEYDNVSYKYLPSSVQVVDISDAGGALEQGARFDVAGTVLSRWQMDEFDGVFRVVSQPGGWGSDDPPVMQTFRVDSSSDIQPAGSLTVQLPRRNEVLQSARFDGTRGFLITAEQRDPLFTFDLSDPANPRQLGEIEMPGWVYHMEPRGNRLYALGFDPENPDGSLNVSLFDVENLAEPRLSSRVAFGNDWGSFAEGQNQIHKAFSILDQQGLILVPFSGGGYDDDQACVYSYGSGIQLIDFTDTTLTRRGVAPQVGSARRALLHRDHLFGVGDNSVQAFDIADRDAPVTRGQLDVARNVSTVRVLDDHLMRFGVDWNTNQTILDMTPVERAAEAQPEAEIDLAALFGEDSWSCRGGASWSGQVFTRGDFAYVPRYSYSYDVNGANYTQTLTFYIVDLTDRAAPRAVGSFAVDPALNDTFYTSITQTDDTLLVGRARGYYEYTPRGTQTNAPRYFYDVIDLADPAAPVVASRFEVPADIAGYGWGWFGVASCTIDMGWGWYGGGNNSELSDGDVVVSQHAEPLPGNDNQVKYYLDRIDVSDPYNPRMLPQVNIPGTAIHFNADTNELVTIDYAQSVEEATSEGDCYARGSGGWFANSFRRCQVTRRSLNSLLIEGDRAIRKSELALDDVRRTSSIAVSDSRIFYVTSEVSADAYRGYAVVDDSPGTAQPAPIETAPVLIESLRLEAGQLVPLPSQELRRLPKDGYYHGQLYARDERVFEVFDNNLTVIDTLVPETPTRLTRELPNWGCQSLEVASDTAYCAVGQRGVEVIDLSSMR